MDVIVVACRCVLALVFLASAASKARPEAFGGFVRELRRAGLPPRPLPPALVPSAAGALVVAEAAVVPLVLLPGTAVVGAGLAAALLLVFLAVIGASMARRSPLSCHCFGSSRTPLGPRHLVRNGALLVVCAGAVPSVPQLSTATAPAFAFAAVVAATVAFVVIRLDDVLHLFAPR